MNKKQFRTLILVTAAAGFLGGAVSDRIFSAGTAMAAKAAAAPKAVTAQEFRLLDAKGATQVRIGYNPDGLATVFWTYNGKDPNLLGKEQSIVIGGLVGFGQPKKPQQ